LGAHRALGIAKVRRNLATSPSFYIEKFFRSEGTIDKYDDKAGLIDFMQRTLKLHSSKILSGAAFFLK